MASRSAFLNAKKNRKDSAFGMEIGRSPAGGGGGRGGGGGGGGGGDRHIPFPRKKGEQIGPFVFFPPPPFFLAEKLEKGGEGGVSL